MTQEAHVLAGEEQLAAARTKQLTYYSIVYNWIEVYTW